MNISFRKLKDSVKDYNLLYKWCKNPSVYEWFEQRELTLEEVTKKYKNKLLNTNQDLYIIKYDDKEIGYTQIYKYEDDTKINNIENYKNLYEFDLFIGEEDYISKGLGSSIIKEISNMIYTKYKADAIMLRPFKRNIRAVKCYEKSGYKLIDEYPGTNTIGEPETELVLINSKE